MMAKATVQTNILEKIAGDEAGATQEELQSYLDNARKYGSASEDVAASSDDVY